MARPRAPAAASATPAAINCGFIFSSPTWTIQAPLGEKRTKQPAECPHPILSSFLCWCQPLLMATLGHRKSCGPGLVQVVAQHLRTAGVTQLRHGLRLDLADALTSDAVYLADLVAGAGLSVR